MKNGMKIWTLATVLAASPVVFASGGHDGHGHMHGDEAAGNGQMMGSDAQAMGMRMVTGEGRINKVMKDKHMMNISHEPMPELNWPKMRMNFKTEQGIDLSGFKPGQEVTFTLQVDQDNNYLIKKIETK